MRTRGHWAAVELGSCSSTEAASGLLMRQTRPDITQIGSHGPDVRPSTSYTEQRTIHPEAEWQCTTRRGSGVGEQIHGGQLPTTRRTFAGTGTCSRWCCSGASASRTRPGGAVDPRPQVQHNRQLLVKELALGEHIVTLTAHAALPVGELPHRGHAHASNTIPGERQNEKRSLKRHTPQVRQQERRPVQDTRASRRVTSSRSQQVLFLSRKMPRQARAGK